MFLNKEEYKSVMELMSGYAKPSPLLAELKAWARDSLQVQVYQYFCDYTNNGLLRIRLVLWDNEVERKLRNGSNLDKKKQELVAGKFAELARKYQLHKEYWIEKDIFVCYETICDEMQRKILHSAKPKIEAIKHPDIWKIEIIFESIHIFYETDEQIAKNKENGASEAIKQRCTDILKQYDVYGAFSNGAYCTFTSHQTLDEKYKGSMFYYTR